MIGKIQEALRESRHALDLLLSNDRSLQALSDASQALASCMKSGNRAFSCGNGGSMSDAMHFAEELTGRFRGDRTALAATAISDPGHITCVANDFGFEYIFSRYIEAHGKKGDFLLAISTSGTSANVINAAEVARKKEMFVVSLTGRESTPLGNLANLDICTASGTRWADRVQELHIKCIHILIELCEQQLFS